MCGLDQTRHARQMHARSQNLGSDHPRACTLYGTIGEYPIVRNAGVRWEGARRAIVVSFPRPEGRGTLAHSHQVEPPATQRGMATGGLRAKVVELHGPGSIPPRKKALSNPGITRLTSSFLSYESSSISPCLRPRAVFSTSQ